MASASADASGGAASGALPADSAAKGSPQPFSNDAQQDFLLAEKQRLGIKKILPPGQNSGGAPGGGGESGESQPNLPATPAPGYQPPAGEGLTMNQSRGQMQQMAEDFERAVQARQAPSVKLDNAATPGLLSNGDNAGAAGTPLGPTPDSTAMANQPQTAGANVSAEQLSMLQGQSSGQSQAESMKKSAAAPSSPAPAAGLANVTLAKRKASSSPAGAVVKSQAALDELWRRMATDQAPPSVDWDSQMIVVVFAPHAPETALEIVSVQPKDGWLVVRYRAVPSDSEQNPGFAAMAVPRSDLPVIYKKAAGTPASKPAAPPAAAAPAATQ
jgi:hypothetical protein